MLLLQAINEERSAARRCNCRDIFMRRPCVRICRPSRHRTPHRGAGWRSAGYNRLIECAT